MVCGLTSYLFILVICIPPRGRRVCLAWHLQRKEEAQCLLHGLLQLGLSAAETAAITDPLVSAIEKFGAAAIEGYKNPPPPPAPAPVRRPGFGNRPGFRPPPAPAQAPAPVANGSATTTA